MLDTHTDESDKRYAQIRPGILERDNHTCQFCGFKASKFQEIHHLDDDHGNNKSSNLVTACCLCHMCFHLGMAGTKDTGSIIWCPEIPQAELNGLCRAIFVAVSNRGKHEDAARKLYESLEARAAVIKEELGEFASNPNSIAQAFVEMTPEQYASRGQRLPGLRLLPKMAAFQKQIAYWQSEPKVYGAFPDGKWESLAPAPTSEPLSIGEAA